jgi:hypothetical protein
MIFTREYKENWNLFNKISFRFLFIYFLLYCLGGFLGTLWEPTIHWLAEKVFSIEYDFSSKGYGSGDTTYQYIQVFLFFCLAIFGAIIWSIADFKRKSYNKLNYGLSVFLRIVLVYYLLVYGMIKVFHMQMIPPTYNQLNQTLGEISPMRLAWVFMGFSKGYSMFAGGAEVLAALLLIPRRTQTLGSIVTIAVMTQVFIMNLCFDIPVKLFSFHLLLMGVVLFLNDFKRTTTFLFTSKAVKQHNIYPKRNKEGSILIPIIKLILIVGFTFFFSSTTLSRSTKFQAKLNPYLAGVWEVTSFNYSKLNRAESYHDDARWKKLVISYEGGMTVQMMDDSVVIYETKVDTIKKSISFNDGFDEFDLNYTLTEDKKIELKGLVYNDSINIKLFRNTKKDFLLTSRGFRWINEIPYNK